MVKIELDEEGEDEGDDEGDDEDEGDEGDENDEDENDEDEENEENEANEDRSQRKSKSRLGSIKKVMKYFNKATGANEDTGKSGKTEEDWYYFYNSTIRLLKTSLDDNAVETMLIDHICETFTLEEDLDAIQLFLKEGELNPIEKRVKRYYEQFIVQDDGITGILLLNYREKEPLQIYVLSNRWKLATYDERSTLSEEIKRKLKLEDELFKWIGYMGNYKGGFDFKVINTELEKLTSAVFENKGRAEMYTIINETVEERNLHNSKNTDVKKIQLGMIEELYLRSFDKMDGMRYFLNKLEIYVVNKNNKKLK
jgi:hypothetical protein